MYASQYYQALAGNAFPIHLLKISMIDNLDLLEK